VLNNKYLFKKAFTLIELLITISLIVVLVSILTAALSAARTAAQIAETQSRLTALKNATIRFKDDIGYYPAVLDSHRHWLQLPTFPTPTTGSPQQSYRYLAQSWYSITSPAEYLLAYGNQLEDGYGSYIDPEDSSSVLARSETPRFGFRHPGVDGVWQSTDPQEEGSAGSGLLKERRPSARGMLYGPYLETENDQMYGRVAFESSDPFALPQTDPVTGQVKVFYPGDPGYDASNPMVIVDTWGSPIRYYRALYPTSSDPTLPVSGIANVFPQNNNYDRPVLSDYFVLRPFSFEPDKVIDTTLPDFMSGVDVPTGDTSTSIELQAGQFAYFSAGPDQKQNNYIRSDYFGQPGNEGDEGTDEANADNIIEVGP